jgi:hypothetical protein
MLCDRATNHMEVIVHTRLAHVSHPHNTCSPTQAYQHPALVSAAPPTHFSLPPFLLNGKPLELKLKMGISTLASHRTSPTLPSSGRRVASGNGFGVAESSINGLWEAGFVRVNFESERSSHHGP